MAAKKFIMPLLALALLGSGGAYGYYWYAEGRYHEVTDNAYVHADEVSIASKLAGYIAEVPAVENQSVHKGDVLLVIDDADFRAELDRADAAWRLKQAALKTMAEQVVLQEAAIGKAAANVEIARVEVDRTTDDFSRYKDLQAKGAASRQKYDYAKADLQKARAELHAARSTVAVEKSRLAVLHAQQSEAESAVRQAEAARMIARQALDDTRIRAPFDGVAGNRSAQVGAVVKPGQQLLVLVPLPGVYVVANFKETQIARMAPGQKVRLEVDAFPEAEITGRVESFSPATGSQFSLLPPENATGNFTKITQRVPVRIRLDESGIVEALRPGLSVVADVDIRDADGSKHAIGSGLATAVAGGQRVPGVN